MNVRQLFFAFLALVSGCTDFPDIGRSSEPYITRKLDPKDSVAVRAILDANSLHDSDWTDVAYISVFSENDRMITVSLDSKGLDTIHVPDGISFGSGKVMISASYNSLRTWQMELTKISHLIDVELSGNVMDSGVLNIGSGIAAVSAVNCTRCGIRKVNFTNSSLAALREMNLNGNEMIDFPEFAFSNAALKVSVRGNSICSPSPALDAFLQRYDRDWRKNQVCTSP
ncbi:MAG: hypothetical protein RL318_390 [Fibrobacterota bacterium]|jgi:hypothetical protein